MEFENVKLFSTYQLNGELRAIQDRIIVEELKTGETVTKTGIVIPDDDAIERGIRPRWGKVYRTGPLQHDVEPGQWVLVGHADYKFVQLMVKKKLYEWLTQKKFYLLVMNVLQNMINMVLVPIQ